MMVRTSKPPATSGTFRPIGEVAAEIVARLRFRRQVERLHRLGPRATAYLLAEIGAERSIQTIIDRKLDTYAELDAAALDVAGGDDFWPVPIRGVRPRSTNSEPRGNRP